MQRVTFDLLQILDPIIRAGLFGLWRVLKYGEHDDNFPGVKQTKDLQWELGETMITLTFRSFADLIPLMRDMLGQFPHGIANPPGYANNPLAAGFYLAVRVHQALFTYFRFKSGGARSESFSLPVYGKNDNEGKRRKTKEKRDAKQKKIQEWKGRFGNEPVESVGTLRRGDNSEPFVMKVTPQMHCPEFPPDDLFLSKTGRLAKSIKMKKVFHPACAKWNNVALKKDPPHAFLIYFSCLSYVYTACKGKDRMSYAGISIDANTFAEADRHHRAWASSTDIPKIITVWGDGTTACWFIAAALGLPDHTYPVITPEGAGLFNPTPAFHPQDVVYKALRGAMRAADANEMFWRVDQVPVNNETKSGVRCAMDVIVSNIQTGATWCRGIEGAVTAKRGKDENTYEGLTKRDRESLARVAHILGGTMEKQVMRRMSKLFGNLVHHYRKHFGVDWNTARKKAMNFAVKSRLNGARHRSTILGAINEIMQEANATVLFSQEESDWLIQYAGENPEDVHSMLILACGGIYNGTSENNPSEDNENNTTASTGAVSR